MSETVPAQAFRDIAADLERRRNRIARVQHSMAVIVGAYDLVTQDLRAAAAAHGDLPSQEEAPK